MLVDAGISGRILVIEPRRMAARLLAGLLAAEARTDAKFFYDAQGSALFDAICHLDEYHPTRIEASIFRDAREVIAREIGREFPAGYQWVDLGCGDGTTALPAAPFLPVRNSDTRSCGIRISNTTSPISSVFRRRVRFSFTLFS